MVRLQQQLGAKRGVVMEGRDIGTVVFPNAEVKIFLDAAPEVRGQRRYEQLERKGAAAPPPPPEEIVRDLRARDARDRNRADSPLKPAPDSVLLDSTNLTLEAGGLRGREDCGPEARRRRAFLLTRAAIRAFEVRQIKSGLSLTLFRKKLRKRIGRPAKGHDFGAR